MFLRRFRTGIHFAICLSLITATPAPLFANSRTSEFKPDFNLQGMQDYDPAFKKFADAPWVTPRLGTFDENDPVLDQDPFFFESQNYGPAIAKENTEGTAFKISSQSIEIQVPGTHQALRLEQPLAPLFEVENFLFLQATDQKLFAEKAGGEDAYGENAYGEGLFFIDKRYLYTELRKEAAPKPVPVFFIPLDGRGWTGKIHRLAFAPMTTIALRNESGEGTTLDLVQIAELSKLLHNNVMMATVMTLKHDPMAIRQLRAKWLSRGGQQVELPYVKLARGSTAAFGLFFTGLNLDHPSDGLYQARKNASLNLNLDLLPRAQASDLLSPDVLERLLIIAQVTGTTMVAGWLAQHTVLRKRMKERRAYIEAKEDQIAVREGDEPIRREGTWFKAKREARETMDVFSHGLAALASGFGAGTGFLLEYGADRFMGHVGQNGMVRWFLEKTFIYSRKQNELIGANWNTFFLGVVILGGIDTMSVVLQLLYVSPIFFPWVGRIFSEELEQKALHQFSGNDASTNNVITSEVMRNLSGYFVHGAYSYSSSQRQVLLEIVRPEIERQMAKEGKEIDDPRYRKEYDRRIELRLEMMLVERGLPTNAEFLFSGPSLMRGLAQLMGYKVNRAKLYQSADYKRSDGTLLSESDRALLQDKKEISRRVSARFDRLLVTAGKYPENAAELEKLKKAGESLKASMVVNAEKAFDHESFVLEKARWGLLSHVLKRALNTAYELHTRFPDDPKLRSAVQILKHTKQKYHFVLESVKRPWRVVENAKDAFKVREMLSFLSYEGQVIGEGVKYLDLWDEAATDPDGAMLAARLYRQSLFGLIQDKPEYLSPKEEDLVKFLPEAREKASEVLRLAPEQVGYDETDREVLALEIVKERVEAAKAKAKTQTWAPPKMDIMEMFQRGHAHREAMIKVTEKLDIEIEPNPAFEVALASGQTEWVNQFGGVDSPMTSEADQLLIGNPEAQKVYQEEYRKALSDVLSLETRPADESDLVSKAAEAAEKDMELNQANNPGWKEYMEKLDPVGKIRYLSHQYADSFLAKYVEMTVSNSSAVSLTSPEQPGVFQKLRSSVFAKSNAWSGRAFTTVLRAFESPMDNTAYRPGVSNWLRRNIPWYQDGKTNVQLTLRIMATSLTIGYFVQYYIWQVKFTWPTAMFFLVTGGITTIVHYWTDRLMMNMGVRPMSDTWSKVKYSLLYTWLTYPSYLPFFLFYDDFNKFWGRWVTTPLGEYVVNPVVSTCEKLLSAIF